MPKKDLISIADLERTEILELLRLARTLKASRRSRKDLKGKTLGLIFQKPSTRTAVSFAVGIYQLGGQPLILNAQDLQLGRGESPADTGRTLSQYLDAIMIRANRHADVVEIARHSSVPVINGLTNKEHPCQVLADLLTLMEVKKLKDPTNLSRERIAYVGDGNNVAQSWMLAAAILGISLTLACPERYEPDAEFFRNADLLSQGKVKLVRDPREAVSGATAVYTDVWTSMGQEQEWEERRKIFSSDQVNSELLKLADPRARVMHCLPAHRGEEITNEVIDGPQSVVFQQAANRLHVQKAILIYLLKRHR